MESCPCLGMCGLGPCVSIDWAGSRMESRGGIHADDDMTLQRVRRPHFLSDNSATNCREHVTTNNHCIIITIRSAASGRWRWLRTNQRASPCGFAASSGVLHANRRASPFGFCCIKGIVFLTNHEAAPIGLLLQLIDKNYYIPGIYNASPFGLLQVDCYSYNTGTNNNA